ncbi:MAG: hypothetical protein NVS4B1_36480 [Ktedonobacteraceae bacterium]
MNEIPFRFSGDFLYLCKRSRLPLSEYIQIRFTGTVARSIRARISAAPLAERMYVFLVLHIAYGIGGEKCKLCIEQLVKGA